MSTQEGGAKKLSFQHRNFNLHQPDHEELEILGYALAELHPYDTREMLSMLNRGKGEVDVFLAKDKKGRIKGGLIVSRGDKMSPKYNVVAIGADDLEPTPRSEEPDKKVSPYAKALLEEMIKFLGRRHLGEEEEVNITNHFRKLQYHNMWFDTGFRKTGHYKPHHKFWARGLEKKSKAEIAKIKKQIAEEKRREEVAKKKAEQEFLGRFDKYGRFAM